MRLAFTIANMAVRGPTELVVDALHNVANKNLGKALDAISRAGTNAAHVKPISKNVVSRSNPNFFKELANDAKNEVVSSVRGKKIDPSEGYKLQKSVREHIKEHEKTKTVHAKPGENLKTLSGNSKRCLFQKKTIKTNTVAFNSIFKRPSGLADALNNPQRSDTRNKV